MLNILQLLPQLIIYVFVALLGFITVSYVLSTLRPATDEAIVGHYTFHMLNSGEHLSGLLSLAQKTISPHHMAIIKQAVEAGLIKTNLKKEDLKKIKLNPLYAYGLRCGTKRILILSKRDIQAPEYSQTERSVYLSLHGAISYRHVYAWEVDVKPLKGWSRVYVIEPLNIQKREFDLERWEAMREIGQLVAVLQPAAEVLAEEMASRRKVKILEDLLSEAEDIVAEEVDRRIRAEMEESREGVIEKPKEEEGMKLPFRFRWWQWLSLPVAYLIGSEVGFQYLVQYYPQITQMQSGLVFAIALFLIYLIYGWRRK